jgi:phytoene synthase
MGRPGYRAALSLRSIAVSAFESCGDLVRHHDPNRYFAALFAPAKKRRYLYALYAFNYEVARVAETVREPMLADIRLAWWRETVEGARAGKPRNHDVARALARTLMKNHLRQEYFERMIAARAFDQSKELFADMEALEEYGDATSGSVMRLAARVLGASNRLDAVAREAGIAYALAGLLRSIPFHAAHGKLFLPADLLREACLSPDEIFAGQGGEKLETVKTKIAERAHRRLSSARKYVIPPTALAAFLPAALVPLMLRARKAELPLYRRQIALFGAAWRKRI